MKSYTPEPWINDPHGIIATSPDRPINDDCETPEGFYGGQLIVESVEDRNSRRIVACVNACKGIPTDILEGKINMMELYEKYQDYVGDCWADDCYPSKFSEWLKGYID